MIATFQGIVEQGHILLPSDVALPENTTVYVIVPNFEAPPNERKFNLSDMIAALPADYEAQEESFGGSVGKEVW